MVHLIQVYLLIVVIVLAFILGIIELKFITLKERAKEFEKMNKALLKELRENIGEKERLCDKIGDLYKTIDNQKLKIIRLIGTRAYKNEILEDLNNWMTYRQLGRKYGFKPNTINKAVKRWRRK